MRGKRKNGQGAVTPNIHWGRMSRPPSTAGAGCPSHFRPGLLSTLPRGSPGHIGGRRIRASGCASARSAGSLARREPQSVRHRQPGPTGANNTASLGRCSMCSRPRYLLRAILPISFRSSSDIYSAARFTG